jgi:Bacterial protein of unknown function (Gcw_chp)
MANRSFTLTTAAGLGLLFALQADAGQANVSLATESTATTASTASMREAATTAAASIVLETQTPPPAAAPAPAPAPPAPAVTGGVNVDLFSHYVWRGFALTDGFAFQPSVFVSTKGLTFTSWSSWSSTDAGCFNADDCPALREHDFTVDYTRPVGSATMSVGYINYLFPPYRTDEAKAADAVGSTNELYAGVTFTAPANPFVKAYFDVDGDEIDTSKGTYLQFGVSQPFPLAEGKVTLTPMFSVAYNFSQWITEDDWNDANLGVKLAIPVGKFTITPSMYLSIGLNDTVKAVGYGDGDTKFYGGVGFSYAF